jgi:hypothetical protein
MVCNRPIYKKGPPIQATDSTPQLHFDNVATHTLILLLDFKSVEIKLTSKNLCVCGLL